MNIAAEQERRLFDIIDRTQHRLRRWAAMRDEMLAPDAIRSMSGTTVLQKLKEMKEAGIPVGGAGKSDGGMLGLYCAQKTMAELVREAREIEKAFSGLPLEYQLVLVCIYPRGEYKANGMKLAAELFHKQTGRTCHERLMCQMRGMAEQAIASHLYPMQITAVA